MLSYSDLGSKKNHLKLDPLLNKSSSFNNFLDLGCKQHPKKIYHIYILINFEDYK